MAIANLRNIKRLRVKTRSSQPITLSAPNLLLWAAIGLLLTIIGTFTKVFVTNFPWDWLEQGIKTHPLSVTYQIGAVLLTGCLGGKNAGALSQIAYVFIGLTVLPVFDGGGGIGYLQEPSFGYLLGFIPAAWLCGKLAFRSQVQLESLASSCICALFVVHLLGILYIIGLSYFSQSSYEASPFQLIMQYSIFPLPGQLIIICAVAVIAFVLRRVLFY
jgi:biotin transport system substrate-specific component